MKKWIFLLLVGLNYSTGWSAPEGVRVDSKTGAVSLPTSGVPISLPTTTRVGSSGLQNLYRDTFQLASNEVDNLLTGLTASSTTQNLFTTHVDTGSSTYVRSTTYFGHNLDLTCVSVYSSTGFPVTVISPREGVGAHHTGGYTNGTTLRWKATDGTVVSRTITSSSQVGTTDIRLVRFSSDLPSTVTPAKVLSSGVPESRLAGAPIIYTDQNWKLFVADISSITVSDTAAILGVQSSTGNRNGFYHLPISGDSSHPVFIVLDGQVVLLGTLYSALALPSIAQNHTAVNSALASLGSSYQLTDYTLTPFAVNLTKDLTPATGAVSITAVSGQNISLSTAGGGTIQLIGPTTTANITSSSGTIYGYVGSFGTLSTTVAIPATSGGTGFASYGIGDILYASTGTALSKLADVATGNVLLSGGVGAAPSYGKVTTSHTSGIAGLATSNNFTGSLDYFNLASSGDEFIVKGQGGASIIYAHNTGGTNQLGFFNSAYVSKQSGNVLTALTNYGLITSPTLAAADLGSGTANSSTYLRGDQTWTTVAAAADDTAFASSWNGVTTTPPSKNSVYDQLHLFDTNDNGKIDVLDLTAGLVKTNSSGAVATAVSNTDYLPVSAPVMSNPQVSSATATTYAKFDGSKNLVSAVAGTDYIAITGTAAAGLTPVATNSSTASWQPDGGTEIAFGSAPGSPVTGQKANFSDSNTNTWGATIAGGGANHVEGRWNGSNWTVVGK